MVVYMFAFEVIKTKLVVTQRIIGLEQIFLVERVDVFCLKISQQDG